MVENEKTVKKGFITEEDISNVLQRYSAATILALLQEVAQVPDEKFDWDALVKNSKTGITNAREYQMLWRHLAYRTSLVEKLDDEEVEPLDDDSDLDCELEALPTVTPEASAEAAACVKVLIASGMPSNSTLPTGSTIEAPLTISIPNRQSAKAPSVNLQPSSFVHGTSITVPVSVQKQPLPAVTPATPATPVTAAEGLDSGNLPPRRKRKPWSDAEDLELLAAVKKCGEGNWANILKGQLMKERSASQLSQRWNIIKKRKGNSSVGGKGNSSLGGKGNSSLGGKGNSSLGGKGNSSLGGKGNSSSGGSSQLSEAQLAARRAMSLALNMPLTDKLKGCSSRGGTTMIHHPAPKIATNIKLESQREHDSHPTSIQRHEMLLPSSKADSVSTPPAQRPSVTGAPQRSIVLGLPSKSLVNLNTNSTKPSSDEMVKATAVAAGARIVTPSDAVSLLKSSGNSLPSNVHYIRTGLATTLSTYSSAPPNDLRLQIQKPAANNNGNHHGQTSPKLDVASETTKVSTSGVVTEVETKLLDGIVPNSVDALKEFADRDDKHVDMDICEDDSANKKIVGQVPMNVDENLSVGVVGGDMVSL